MIRFALALCLAAMAAGPAASQISQIFGVGQPGYTPTPIAVKVGNEPITHFGEPKSGPLSYLGGVKLSADFKGFGGFSGLQIDGDGKRLVAISDAGMWLTADLVHEGERLIGIENARMAPLLDDAGKPLGITRRNAEGMTRLANGDILVSFERRAVMLRRYPFGRQGVAAAGRRVTPFKSMQGLSGNAGLEAIAFCPDGRFVGIAEAVKDGKARGWIWRTGGPAAAFAVATPDDFAVTDVVCLDTGEVVTVERRTSSLWRIAVRLRRITLEALEKGAAGETLLEAGINYNIDNFEGIAVHKKNGRTILTLISDDNFNRLIQSTLLMQFELN